MFSSPRSSSFEDSEYSSDFELDDFEMSWDGREKDTDTESVRMDISEEEVSTFYIFSFSQMFQFTLIIKMR